MRLTLCFAVLGLVLLAGAWSHGDEEMQPAPDAVAATTVATADELAAAERLVEQCPTRKTRLMIATACNYFDCIWVGTRLNRLSCKKLAMLA